MWPKVAMNAAQHKIVHLLKTFFCSSVFTSVCVFNVWLKKALLPVWPRDAKTLDIPARIAQLTWKSPRYTSYSLLFLFIKKKSALL